MFSGMTLMSLTVGERIVSKKIVDSLFQNFDSLSSDQMVGKVNLQICFKP